MVVNRAIAMGTGDLNPHFFLYPSLWIYLVFFVQGSGAVLGLGLGLFKSFDHIATLAFADPTYFYASARLLTAIVGAIGVWVSYRIGLLWSKWTGVIAGLGLMLFGPYVHKAHYANPDVPLAVFSMFTLFTCLLALKRSSASLWSLWIPAILAGLTTSIKYNGFVVVFTVIALQYEFVQVENSPPLTSFLCRGFKVGLISIAAFFLTSPYAILDYPAFIRGLERVIEGTAMIDRFDPINTYFWLCIENYGWGITVLGAGGFIVPFIGSFRKQQKKRILLLLSFGVPYLLLIHWSDLKVARFFLPVATFLPLGLGIFFHNVFRSNLLRAEWSKTAKLMVLLFLVFMFVTPVRATSDVIETIHEYSASTRAGRWIKRCVKPGTKIIVDRTTGVELLPDREAVKKRIEGLEGGVGQPGKRSQLLRAYNTYLDSTLPEEGYGLTPTSDELLNTFNLGYAPSQDYKKHNLAGVKMIVATESIMNRSTESASKFYNEFVRKRFEIFRDFSHRGRTIRLLVREGVDKNFLSPQCLKDPTKRK
jgi:hypothetical protein